MNRCMHALGEGGRVYIGIVTTRLWGGECCRIWFLEFGDLYIVHHSGGFFSSFFCSFLPTC